MIDKLLIFLDSGLLLFKKYSTDQLLNEQDDLVTGFFSAILHYLSDQQMGIIHSIKTDKKFIQIKKVQNMYIALLGSILNCNNVEKIIDFDRTSHFNTMIENFAQNLLNNINMIVINHLKRKSISNGLEWPDNLFFKEIENKIDIHFDRCNKKIEIIEKMTNIEDKPTNQIYKILH